MTGFQRYSLTSQTTITINSNKKREKSLTENAVEFVDFTLNLLLSTTENQEPSPLQIIMIEELSKIFSSGTRLIYMKYKLNSMKLFNGRSIVGNIIDPFNIIPFNQLFATNIQDERVLNATYRLIQLVSIDTSLQSTLQHLTSQEIQQLIQIIIIKLYEKRILIMKLILNLSSTIIIQNMNRLTSVSRPSSISEAPTVFKVSNSKSGEFLSKSGEFSSKSDDFMSKTGDFWFPSLSAPPTLTYADMTRRQDTSTLPFIPLPSNLFNIYPFNIRGSHSRSKLTQIVPHFASTTSTSYKVNE